MSAAFFSAMLLLGLASGVHCVGMCGGFVAAFSTFQGIPVKSGQRRSWLRLALFNAGRISTYAALGAASGFVGGKVALALGAQSVLYVLANVMLVAVGLHLAGATRFLAPLENLAAPLWRRVPRPGFDHPYAAGLAWGFIPCGLVYGALAAAAFAGTAIGGAAAMLAYGMGTLPWLLAAGMACRAMKKPVLRQALGVGVLAFGVYGLAHASSAAQGLRGWLCL